MKNRNLLGLLAGLLLAAALPAAALAEALEASLDGRLAANDTPGLIALMKQHMTPEDKGRVIRWLKTKVDSGEAPDQFAMTLALYNFHAGGLDEGLFYLNYERALIMIDSATCPDASAGGALLEGTVSQFANVARVATPAQKTTSIDQAMALEQKTAPVRKLDPTLCSNGPKKAKADHASADVKPRPPAASAEAAPATTPPIRLAADPEWKKKRAAALPGMKEMLLTLNGLWTPK